MGKKGVIPKNINQIAGWNKGIPHTKEHKANLKKNHWSKKEGFVSHRLGKKSSKETRRKISEAQRGRKHSEETKRKRSVANKGQIPWIKGKHHTKETKEKISINSKGRVASKETRKKLSKANKGSKCNFWKGGITPINLRIRSSIEYRLWREAVFERDKYTCIWCGAKSGNGKAIVLNADHIKPFALFPELRFAIDNGRTLCENCHRKTNTYGGNSKK